MTARKAPRWVPKSAVLAMHEMLISEHGGMPRLRSDALLDSTLASPRDLFGYEAPDLFALAARYAVSLTKNHPFHDGNKRISLTVAGVFLEMNGLRLEAPEADAVSAVLALSTNEMSERDFGEWLRIHSSRLKKSRPRESRRPAKRRPRTKRQRG